MIKLYQYTLTEYEGKLIFSEKIAEVDEQVSENKFISKSKYFNDYEYETNNVSVCLANEDMGYWQDTQACVLHKEKQSKRRIQEQLKQAILVEIENERLAKNLMYQQMIKDYENMEIS